MNKSVTQGFDISGKSAALIGCGGLGCHIAAHLAGAGLGTLYICDFDTVSETNLNRQFFYTVHDTGKKKTELLQKRLSDYAPDCTVIPIDRKIEKAEDLLFAEACDAVVLAVDNIRARKAVQEFCFRKKIPFVNGGINGYYGVSYLCIPGKSACLGCAGLLSSDNVAERSVSSSAGIIGAHNSGLIQKYLCGDTENAGKLFVYDSGEITSLMIKKKNGCPLCSADKN